jgi:hypothetical protein
MTQALPICKRCEEVTASADADACLDGCLFVNSTTSCLAASEDVSVTDWRVVCKWIITTVMLCDVRQYTAMCFDEL